MTEVVIVSAQPPTSKAESQLLSDMLHEAGFLESECAHLYLMPRRFMPKEDLFFFGTKTEAYANGVTEVAGKYPRPEVLAGRGRLLAEIEAHRPIVTIAFGEAALWATTGNCGITKYRGSIEHGSATGSKVIATYAPAKINVMWNWRFIAVQDLRRAFRESKFRGIEYPDYDFLIQPNFSDVMDQLEKWQETADRIPIEPPHMPVAARSPGLTLAADIETRAGHITCLGLGDSPLHAMCIPFVHSDEDVSYWSHEEEVAIVLALRKLLSHPRVEVVGQNFHYDAQYIVKHWGFIPNLVHDTMIEHHVCFAGLPKALDFLASMYCKFYQYWKDEGKEWNPTINDTQRWTYNCKDVVNTFECHQAIQRTVDAYGLREPARRQMRAWRPVLNMMLRGVRIDTKTRDAMGLQLMEAMTSREQWMLEVAGDTVPKPKSKTAKPWYRSSQQLANYLYNVLGLPPQRHRKTGRITTNDEALEKLRKREPVLRQFFDCLSEYRSVGVFLQTFVRAPLDPDKRMRCSFTIPGTETYRYSSSSDAFGFGTNLQNIPAGNEDD